jgi:hypothetical protein
MDPDRDPGGPKTCGSATLLTMSLPDAVNLPLSMDPVLAVVTNTTGQMVRETFLLVLYLPLLVPFPTSLPPSLPLDFCNFHSFLTSPTFPSFFLLLPLLSAFLFFFHTFPVPFLFSSLTFSFLFLFFHSHLFHFLPFLPFSLLSLFFSPFLLFPFFPSHLCYSFLSSRPHNSRPFLFFLSHFFLLPFILPFSLLFISPFSFGVLLPPAFSSPFVFFLWHRFSTSSVRAPPPSSVVDPHHVDADPDAYSDSTYHPDADSDYDFKLMLIRIFFMLMRFQIRIRLFTLMRIQILASK